MVGVAHGEVTGSVHLLDFDGSPRRPQQLVRLPEYHKDLESLRQTEARARGCFFTLRVVRHRMMTTVEGLCQDHADEQAGSQHPEWRKSSETANRFRKACLQRLRSQRSDEALVPCG